VTNLTCDSYVAVDELLSQPATRRKRCANVTRNKIFAGSSAQKFSSIERITIQRAPCDLINYPANYPAATRRILSNKNYLLSYLTCVIIFSFSKKKKKEEDTDILTHSLTRYDTYSAEYNTEYKNTWRHTSLRARKISFR